MYQSFYATNVTVHLWVKKHRTLLHCNFNMLKICLSFEGKLCHLEVSESCS